MKGGAKSRANGQSILQTVMVKTEYGKHVLLSSVVPHGVASNSASYAPMSGFQVLSKDEALP